MKSSRRVFGNRGLEVAPDAIAIGSNEMHVFGGGDDTFDDIAVDYSQLGSDGAPRIRVPRSSVKHNRRVRDTM